MRALHLRAASAGVVLGLVATGLAIAMPADAADTASIAGSVTYPTGVTAIEAMTRAYAYPTSGATYNDDAESWTAVATVGADGTFVITGLAAGSYKVLFDGFGADAAARWWPAADDFESAASVTVGEGEQVGIDAELDAGATISGTVVGGTVSEGLGWALAYRRETGGWRTEGSAEIADDGSYRIEGMRAGTYRLMYSAVGGFEGDLDGEAFTGWQEWSGDAMSSAKASTVTLTAEQDLTGVDADLDTVAGVRTWPTVSGTARVGSTLKAKAGAWPAGTKLTYRWYANGRLIPGAKSSTWKLTAAQRGARVMVGVFGRKTTDVGWEATFSPATATVAAGTLSTATPTVSGTAVVGTKLKAKTGTWTSGTKLTYRWYANGRAISKATGSAYTLTSAQKGKKITVKVTGTLNGYTTVGRTSRASTKVATAATPKISGTAKVGKKLTAKPGTWTSGMKLAYRWYANGKAISKATASTYTVRKAQKGKRITVRVTGTKAGYPTVSRTSKATSKVR